MNDLIELHLLDYPGGHGLDAGQVELITSAFSRPIAALVDHGVEVRLAEVRRGSITAYLIVMIDEWKKSPSLAVATISAALAVPSYLGALIKFGYARVRPPATITAQEIVEAIKTFELVSENAEAFNVILRNAVVNLLKFPGKIEISFPGYPSIEINRDAIDPSFVEEGARPVSIYKFRIVGKAAQDYLKKLQTICTVEGFDVEQPNKIAVDVAMSTQSASHCDTVLYHIASLAEDFGVSIIPKA